MPSALPSSILRPRQLQAALRSMAGRRVAVLGDAILDAFLWGDATRISPEAPVPVVLLDRQTWSLGGAANVAANIAALGGRPMLFSVLGDDDAGIRLLQLAKSANVAVDGASALAGRPTTVKNRVLARNKHLLRFDHEDTSPIPAAATRSLLAALRAAGKFDAVVISDYAKGCVTPELARGVQRYCQTHHLPWCVDPKSPAIHYRRATVLKPNMLELELLSGFKIRTPEDLPLAAFRVLRRHGCQNLLVTRGQHGMTVFNAAGLVCQLNGGGQAVADVTGAGDTVSAVLALGLAAKLHLIQAAHIANLAAGYVVTLPGTAAVRQTDLLDFARRR